MTGIADSKTIHPRDEAECTVLFRASIPGGWKKEFVGIMAKSIRWGSRRCSLSWRAISSPLKRMCLQISVRRSPDADRSALLPTPVASDGTRGRSRIPVIKDGKPANISTKGVSYGISIGQLAMAGLLPTPGAGLSGGKCNVDRGKGNPEYHIAAKLKPSVSSRRVSALFVGEMMGFPESWLVSPFRD